MNYHRSSSIGSESFFWDENFMQNNNMMRYHSHAKKQDTKSKQKVLFENRRQGLFFMRVTTIAPRSRSKYWDTKAKSLFLSSKIIRKSWLCELNIFSRLLSSASPYIDLYDVLSRDKSKQKIDAFIVAHF